MNNYQFIPIHELSRARLDLIKDRLLCLDDKDMQVSGNHNSDRFEFIHVRILRCNDTENSN